MSLRYFLPAIAWALFIFVLTLMPGKYIPPANIWDISNLDKFVHLSVFAILVVLLLYGFLKQRQYQLPQDQPVLLAFILCVAYGFLLEVMQGTLLVDRYFEWYDALANTLGCGAGIVFFNLVLKKKIKEPSMQ